MKRFFLIFFPVLAFNSCETKPGAETNTPANSAPFQARRGAPLEQALVKRVVDYAESSSLASAGWGYHRHNPPQYTKKGDLIEAVAKRPPPIGYTKGMALAYADAYNRYKTGGDSLIEMLSGPANRDRELDMLYQFRGKLLARGINTRRGGVKNLRATFAIIYELGVRESDGRHYLGIDDGKYKPNEKIDAETTEAGLFQASHNYTFKNPLGKELFNQYRQTSGTFWLRVFREGVPRPKNNNDRSIGGGTGRQFQDLTKANPRFAVDFAAQTARQTAYWEYKNTMIGGVKRYFFLRNGFMDVSPVALKFFSDIEQIVDGELR